MSNDHDEPPAGNDASGPRQDLGGTASGPEALDLKTGTIVGEYRIESAIGRGGMGIVYSAVHPVIEKRVAIKILHAQFSSDPALVRRFVDEARAVNRIRHDNIIDIFSFGQLPDGRHYFVMEYLEGATLAEKIERGTLDMSQASALLVQITDALDAAHGAGIVHRDLKPENIWVVSSRHGRQHVKLLDFGIAKLASAGDQNVTQTGIVMGTPHFMSPEQCYGRNIDHRTDIYAMGVILYRVYAGRFPFDGDTFTEIIAKHVTAEPESMSRFAPVSARLDALVLSCLAKEPAARPQSAGELGNQLIQALAEPPGAITQAGASATAATAVPFAKSATATSAPSAESQSPVRSRRSVFLAGAFVLAAGLVAALWATLGSPAKTDPKGQASQGSSARTTDSPTSAAVPSPAPSAPKTQVVDETAKAPVAKTEVRGTANPDAGSADDLLRKRRAAAAASPPSPSAPVPTKVNRSRASDKGLVTDNPFE